MIKKFRKLLGELRLSTARKGPYRFMTGDLRLVSDINVASRVFGTEYFRDMGEALPLPIHDFDRYLVVAPHQDDEAIGAGGLMHQLHDLGAKVDVLFLSDGRQTNLPDKSVSESIEIRFEEAKQALKTCGADFHRVDVDNTTWEVDLDVLNRIDAIFSKLEPQVVLLPWLLDAPVKHRLSNHIMALSHFRTPWSASEIWSYQVHNTLYGNLYTDITEVMPRKLEMIKAYVSQLESYQHYDHLAEGMAAWNSRFLPKPVGSAKKRYAEMYFGLPTGEYFSMLERMYMYDTAATYRNKMKLAEPTLALHHQLRSN